MVVYQSSGMFVVNIHINGSVQMFQRRMKKEEEVEMERERIAKSHEKILEICLFIVNFDAEP